MSDNQTATTRVITIRLRIPALVLISALVIGGLVWAFVLGIMVGRGQINDQLEALRPAAQQAASADVEKAADEVEKLIKAEDLKYQESLRQNPPAQTTPKPASSQTDAASLAQAARNDSTTAQPAAQVAAPSASGQKYSYTYQVASYTKEAQAKDMQAKLKAKGVDAQIESKIIQNTTWFRILVSFKGDDSSVTSMQEMLKKDFKINSILPRSKTALGG